MLLRLRARQVEASHGTHIHRNLATHLAISRRCSAASMAASLTRRCSTASLQAACNSTRYEHQTQCSRLTQTVPHFHPTAA